MEKIRGHPASHLARLNTTISQMGTLEKEYVELEHQESSRQVSRRQMGWPMEPEFRGEAKMVLTFSKC